MIQQAAEATTLTIHQMIDRLKEQYPSAEFLGWDNSFPCSCIRLENGWSVSFSYASLSCCGAKFEKDPLDSTTVEIAIFTPKLEWYLAEGMDVSAAARTGVFCWKDSDFVFQIVEYISGKEGPVRGR